MSTPAIEPGLKGTLSPAEYATKTAPSWGQTYLSAVAAYGDMDYVCIAFATDAAMAAALIPKELQLIQTPALPADRPWRTSYSPNIVSVILGRTWR